MTSIDLLFSRRKGKDAIFVTFDSLRQGYFNATEFIFEQYMRPIEVLLFAKFQSIQSRNTPHAKENHGSEQVVFFYPSYTVSFITTRSHCVATKMCISFILQRA